MASWCWPNGLQTMPVVSPPPEGDFGPRKTGKGFHDGQDFKALFSPVRSVGAGQVVRVEPWNGKVSMQHGNRVYIYHGNGIESSYSHLGRIDVGKGQQVVAGTSVGPLGGTGFVTGPHLHFEVRVYGVLVDPVPFIRNMIAAPSGGGFTPFPVTPPKPKEWDEMASREEIGAEFDARMAAFVTAMRAGQGFNAFVIHGTGKVEDSADPRNGVWLFTNGKATQLAQGSVDFLNAWSTTDGKSVASNFDTFVTGGNPGAFDDLKRMFVLELVPADLTDPVVSESVLAVLKTALEEGIQALIPTIKSAAREGINGATIRAAAT